MPMIRTSSVAPSVAPGKAPPSMRTRMVSPSTTLRTRAWAPSPAVVLVLLPGRTASVDGVVGETREVPVVGAGGVVVGAAGGPSEEVTAPSVVTVEPVRPRVVVEPAVPAQADAAQLAARIIAMQHTLMMFTLLSYAFRRTAAPAASLDAAHSAH